MTLYMEIYVGLQTERIMKRLTRQFACLDQEARQLGNPLQLCLVVKPPQRTACPRISCLAYQSPTQPP
jgi:hypothetical protein